MTGVLASVVVGLGEVRGMTALISGRDLAAS